MLSFFHILNQYQDGIVAAVVSAMGIAQAGVCSWGIHKVIMDEQFLIYVIGHAMHNKAKTLQEAIAHYESLREHLQHDLFDLILLIKSAFSIALVAGICLTLSSASIVLFGETRRRVWRILWIATGLLSLLGLIGGFGLAFKFFVQNVIYLQVFLVATTVNIILLSHILLALLGQEAYNVFLAKRKKGESTDKNSDTGPTLDEAAIISISSSNVGPQTDELPPAPPSPVVDRHGTNSSSTKRHSGPVASTSRGSKNRNKSLA